MKTAIDTNVFVALWEEDDQLSFAAQCALDKASNSGTLVISPPVYCELIAAPGRSQSFVDRFLKKTAVMVDWKLEPTEWRAAAEAFARYAHARREQDPSRRGPRRILADFLIGAHASHRTGRLMTLDTRLYRSAFPSLQLVEL